MGFNLFQDDGSQKLKPFLTKITYEDSHGKSHETCQTLDVAPCEGLVTLGKSAEHEIAESLKAIKNHLDRFATNQGRLKVETISTAEVSKQNEDALERARARSKEKRGENTDGKHAGGLS